MGIVSGIVIFVRALLSNRAAIAAENLVLRQQLGVLQRSVKRPRLRRRDRVLWVWLSRLWSDWRTSLVIVKPATVIRWHREGLRLYWHWKSRGEPGRPKINAEVRQLIRRMSLENPIWGAPRIQSELALLGYTAAESTIAKYTARHRKPASQTWRTFLENHVPDIAAVDFFAVATTTCSHVRPQPEQTIRPGSRISSISTAGVRLFSLNSPASKRGGLRPDTLPNRSAGR